MRFQTCTNSRSFRDKQKESSRQKKLLIYRETGNWPGMKPKPVQSKAWSEKQDAKAKKLDRKRKKELKRITQDEKESDMVAEDSDDLENDFKLLKKLKKGKVGNFFMQLVQIKGHIDRNKSISTGILWHYPFMAKY